ncbi:hypothetical protein B566_EDAN011165 [Ephemera danica]|nr:hypothetical protein B566_EDAN011165 [Ephemera danica]
MGYNLNRDLGALVHGIVPDRNYYLIVERIQRLFLPFWPHPPVALVLMCYYGVNLQPPHVSLPEVPTLQHLARTALRGGFKFGRTDGVGLDLSSLRVKWQGNMLVVPQLIKNFINFKPLLFRPVKKT